MRYLVTNSGWGTGMDVRPNPGIGFPGYADYFPATRGAPEPPSIRYPGGPAPGPIPYPGAPAYGAPAIRPGRNAAVSRPAAGTTAGPATRTRPGAGGLGTVRAGRVRAARNQRCGIVTQPPLYRRRRTPYAPTP